jgi:hypothetical protein
VEDVEVVRKRVVEIRRKLVVYLTSRSRGGRDSIDARGSICINPCINLNKLTRLSETFAPTDSLS